MSENGEVIEEFFSGFCRTCNGVQSVCCEYFWDGQERILEFMDCAHKSCIHRGACEIYKQAAGMGRERE